MELYIPETILECIISHARETAPAECCGYLATDGWTARKLIKMTNVDESATHYTMDPAEQFEALRQAREAGLQLRVVYHSHPETPPRMSAEDLRLAHDQSVIYLIYSLATREARGYTVSRHAVDEEISIRIIPKKAEDGATHIGNAPNTGAMDE
jgi:proteasome lid subunit RPN8/RPN11